MIFVLTIIISACSPSLSATLPSTSESAPTITQVPATLTTTETPTIPPTFTPTPTLSLPVSQLTPVPSSNTKITKENVQSLQEIAKYYGEINYFAKVTKDNKFLFILDADGLTKYGYASMATITHVAVANSVSALQISDDGGLLLLDNKWLLDLKNDKEPKLYVLSEKIRLLNFYTTFSLSPDGTVLAVEQVGCKNLCEHLFRIVSTADFKELYASSAATYQDLPTFSSDGKYFALANLTQVATSGGGTQPAGAAISVWTTRDFIMVSSMNVKFPFNVSSIAFSEDNTLLAIAQENSISIYDIPSGDPKVTIADLCESGIRKVIFAPSSTIMVLEHSDCSSGEWTVSGSTARLSADNVPDLSRITFDENGNFKAISYTQPTPDLRAYRQEYYFEFLNNDILSFKSFDAETLDRHSCDLSLANGSLDCQSHAPEYYWEGSQLVLSEYKDVILATDGKYYSYVVGKSKVDIYSFDDPSQVYYSIPFRDYGFELLALDPVNNIVIYNIALSMRANRVIIQDMTNDHLLEKWEGETFLDSIVFSENKKFAALCRTIGYTNSPNKDKLVIFDLSEKRTKYNSEFTCSGTALSISSDGSKLAAEHRYLPNATTLITRVTILNTSPPYETKHLDFESWFYPYATAFSPDGSMLAAGCSNNDICFLDPSDGREIYRTKAHSGISNMAFSKDGSVLATSSNWGLISLWAVPPFTSNDRKSQPSPISFYTPNFSWDFNEDGNFDGFGGEDWQSGDLNNLKVRNGSLSAGATGNDPQIYSNEGLGIDTTKFTQIEIRMRVSSGDSAELFFRHDKDDMSGDKLKTFSIHPGNEFNTYIINMSTVTSWTGIISQLRLDPTVDAIGATIEIDYIRLLPPGFSWNFDESGNLEGWENWGEIDNADVPNGYFYAKTIGSDPQIYSSEGLGIDANKFSHIEIRMHVSEGDSAQLFFRNENNDLSENNSITFPIESGTEFKTYVLDMGKISNWKDIIYQLRFDPTSDVIGAIIEIDYIRLLP